MFFATIAIFRVVREQALFLGLIATFRVQALFLGLIAILRVPPLFLGLFKIGVKQALFWANNRYLK